MMNRCRSEVLVWWSRAFLEGFKGIACRNVVTISSHSATEGLIKLTESGLPSMHHRPSVVLLRGWVSPAMVLGGGACLFV